MTDGMMILLTTRGDAFFDTTVRMVGALAYATPEGHNGHRLHNIMAGQKPAGERLHHVP